MTTDIYCNFKVCDAWADPNNLPDSWIEVTLWGGTTKWYLCSLQHARYLFNDPGKYNIDGDIVRPLLDKDGKEIC